MCATGQRLGTPGPQDGPSKAIVPITAQPLVGSDLSLWVQLGVKSWGGLARGLWQEAPELIRAE